MVGPESGFGGLLHDTIWLPEGVLWSDLERERSGEFLQYVNVILIPLVLAVVLLILKEVFFTYVFRPFFKTKMWTQEELSNMAAVNQSHGHTNVSGSQQPGTQENETPRRKEMSSSKRSSVPFENGYAVGLHSRSNSSEVADAISKRTDAPRQNVGAWLKKMQALEARTGESAWSTMTFLVLFPYGLWAVGNKSYFWDVRECWLSYPKHPIPSEIFWYYMLEIGFYWSQIYAHCFQAHRKKDFWQMLIHHIATLCLLFFSWVCNFTRIGVLILVLHDCADIFLQAGKFCKNMEWKTYCNVAFVLFVISWFYTRLYLYPVVILHSVAFHIPDILGSWPLHKVFLFLLSLLFVLHIIWTFMILSVIKHTLRDGSPRDNRSPESSDVEE